MNGNLRWGTGAHATGCDHLWTEWTDAHDTPMAYLGTYIVRWCLFCATSEYEEDL